MKEKIRKIITNNYIKNIFLILLIMESFIILDVGFRYRYNIKITSFEWNLFSPNLFTLFYALIFTIIIYILPRKIGKFVYLIIYGLNILIITSQSIHYETLMRFWAFDDLFLVGEGADYVLDSLKYIDKKLLILLIGCLIILIFTFYLFNKIPKLKLNNRFKISTLFSLILILGIIRTNALIKLGTPISNTNFESSLNLRNIYDNYIDSNKSLFVSGIYEYLSRNTYLYFHNKSNYNKENDIKSLDEYFEKQNNNLTKNSHTGILKDKNLIIIMLESVDNWLITEEVMPTLTKLKNTGINFTNRFAPTFGSGYTFNTEFSLNTGYYSPLNGGAFNYTNNTYPYTLPKLLKENGYKVNSIHKNYGSFYKRTAMHKSFGYEHHYALADMFKLDNYKLDSDFFLADNDEFYNLIVDKNNKFMTFVTTYSVHMPYDNRNKHCSKEEMNESELKVDGNELLTCVKLLANLTDLFLERLIERLEEDELLDNTSLVLVTDHFMYAYNDKEYIYKIKDTKDNNMLQKTPFIIWSKDIVKETNSNPLGTVDILPTLLNMLDIKYVPKYYFGYDIYSSNYPNYVYFKDNSWYDGNYHIISDKMTDEEKIIAQTIYEKIKFNDKIFKSNYFETLNKLTIINFLL